MGAFSDLAVQAIPAASAGIVGVPLPFLGLVAGDLLALLGVICALVPAGLVLRSELRRRRESPVTVYRFPAEAQGSAFSAPRRG